MLALIIPLMLSVVDLGDHFAKEDAWTESAVDFAVEHQKDGFGFASQKRDIVNCMGRGHCTWRGLDVWEARIFYAAEGATRVEMSMYNRGDDKGSSGLNSVELGKLLDDIASKAQPGGKIGSNPEKKKLRTGGFQLSRYLFPEDIKLLIVHSPAIVSDLYGTKISLRDALYVYGCIVRQLFNSVNYGVFDYGLERHLGNSLT